MHGCHGGVDPWLYVRPLCVGAAPPCLVFSCDGRRFWESTGRHDLRGSISKAAAFVRKYQSSILQGGRDVRAVQMEFNAAAM